MYSEEFKQKAILRIKEVVFERLCGVLKASDELDFLNADQKAKLIEKALREEIENAKEKIAKEESK